MLCDIWSSESSWDLQAIEVMCSSQANEGKVYPHMTVLCLVVQAVKTYNDDVHLDHSVAKGPLYERIENAINKYYIFKQALSFIAPYVPNLQMFQPC